MLVVASSALVLVVCQLWVSEKPHRCWHHPMSFVPTVERGSRGNDCWINRILCYRLSCVYHYHGHRKHQRTALCFPGKTDHQATCNPSQPTRRKEKEYRSMFLEWRARCRRSDRDWRDCHLRIVKNRARRNECFTLRWDSYCTGASL